MQQSKKRNREYLEYKISGLNCMDCAWKIEMAVSKLKWVGDAKVNFPRSLLRVLVKEGENDVGRIEKEIEREIGKIGFGLEKGGNEDGTFELVKKKSLFLLTITSGILIIAGLVISLSNTPYSIDKKGLSVIFYLTTIIIGGYYIGKRGILAIFSFRLDINILMCLAVIGAAYIGEWLEGATVIFLFLLAQLLETYTLDKARNAIKALMEISPREALVRYDSGEKKVSVNDVKVGDVILIKPGERIPLDGNVVNGKSTVNQSPITGESISIEKSFGDEIYAGTINENGALDVKVTHLSKDSTLSKIIHLIEEAQSQKAPFQSFVDNFAKYYTPIIIVIAFLVATIPPLIFYEPLESWLYRALVLLVISCPCALVISTPVSLISGITSAARNGVLFKGGIYLEYIGEINTIAFDKTGTLTVGNPIVTDIIPVKMNDEDDILKLAASIEARSEHSIANAILKMAKQKKIALFEGANFRSFTGKGAVMEIDDEKYYVGNLKFFYEQGFSVLGIDGILENLQESGKTSLLLGRDQTVLGIIAVADEIRKCSKQTIDELYNKGIEKIIMLTGDYKTTAKTICKQLNINKYMSELSPEGKVGAVKTLIKEYGKIGMVGDGINDAPALAEATVGVAMGKTGTDITLESADVMIMGDDLTKLPFAITLGRKTTMIIKQNIAMSIIIKFIFLILVIPGFTTLWMAVGADMGASLIVIINGLRLLRQ